MIYNHGAHPAQFGGLTRVFNCGDFGGPCIQLEHEHPSRGVTFAGAPPQDLWIPEATPQPTPHPYGEIAATQRKILGLQATPSVRPIRFNRIPIVEGYNPPGQSSDVVRFGALTVPFFFDTFEGGDLRMWTTVVGGSKNAPPR